ncbi:hypothetical protein [Ruminococcus flavefaciens]|uniref:hypothetical protein n=1 Tax=Ruminococcus flavefaciens TaxID=1265 RepID=UPI0002E3D93F|nr:hypothetical protein [Ruminococcus flavefaciens]
MDYIFSYVTTEGAVRKVNQDSLFAAIAEFRDEKIFFGAVCDGVGGLSSGEKASVLYASASVSGSLMTLPIL